jgi:hypothetical protein
VLQKKAKEESAELNGVIAETYGQLTFSIVPKGETLESQLELLNMMLRSAYSLLKNANKSG